MKYQVAPKLTDQLIDQLLIHWSINWSINSSIALEYIILQFTAGIVSLKHNNIQFSVKYHQAEAKTVNK